MKSDSLLVPIRVLFRPALSKTLCDTVNRLLNLAQYSRSEDAAALVSAWVQLFNDLTCSNPQLTINDIFSASGNNFVVHFGSRGIWKEPTRLTLNQDCEHTVEA